MYDMLGRLNSEDVRDRSVAAMLSLVFGGYQTSRAGDGTRCQIIHHAKEALGLDDEDADLLRRTANFI